MSTSQIYPHSVSDIRQHEYPSIAGVTYLDHGGTTLLAKSLMQRFTKDVTTSLFGNPHSASPSSALSTLRIERVRKRVLDFLKADPKYFDVVFVANATAAIKLVADGLREIPEPGFWYGYHKDAHTSLVGVREYASSSHCFVGDNEVDAWLLEDGQDFQIEGLNGKRHGLFAYPAQSNMNGHRPPLDWSGRIRNWVKRQNQQLDTVDAFRGKIFTMVDAAALLTTSPLDLSDSANAPDFVTFSFYKIFGFPDLGALVVRKSAGEILSKRKFVGGGTVDMVTVIGDQWHSKKTSKIHEQLEDGTLPFHGIIALDSAMDVHEELYGSMENVSKHTQLLATQAFMQLCSLKHHTGLPVVEIYKDARSEYGDPKTQGPTLSFNIRNAQGGWVGKSDVEQLAMVRGIHLRSGGVCNPGGIATSCGLASWEMKQNFSEGMRCGDNIDILRGKPTGIVRISLGAMSSMLDVTAFTSFVRDMFVETHEIRSGKVERTIPSQSTESIVQTINIFPVSGCKSWTIPHSMSWPVSAYGLAWDREWCFMRPQNLEPMSISDYPQLSLITPELDLKAGFLILRASHPANKISEAAEATQFKVQISIWESPASVEHALGSDLEHLPADPYTSPDILSFCKAVFGVECTLARFRDFRRVSKDAGISTTKLTRLEEGLITVASVASGNTAANITLSGSNRWQGRDFVQIESQFFECKRMDTSKKSSTSGLWRLRHLEGGFDRSLSSQSPCLRVGDYLRGFSSRGAKQNDELQACIEDSAAPQQRCPVWNCREGYPSHEALLVHYKTHRQAPIPPTRKTSREISSVAVFEVTIPYRERSNPTSQLITKDEQAALQRALSAAPEAVPRPQTSRRTAWKKRLTTVLLS